MASRRGARRLAIDILYQADITGVEPLVVMKSWREADREVPAFTEELVAGVSDHGPSIDLLLAEHAEGWTVARMPAVDRTILRLAVEELLHRDDVPPSVAISEAVEAASDLSADDSRPFINGLLGKIARGAQDQPDVG